MPDDFIALPNLFLLLAGWQLAGAIAIVVVPFVLLLLMINWRHRRTWLLLGLYAVAVWGTLHQAGPAVAMMDKVFGNSVWNQRGNLESRGVLDPPSPGIVAAPGQERQPAVGGGG